MDFAALSSLTFHKPDYDTFKCLSLAIDAIKTGGTAPAYLNGANEAAVELFLNEKIGFLDIADVIGEAMNKHSNVANYSLNDVLNADKSARKAVMDIIGG